MEYHNRNRKAEQFENFHSFVSQFSNAMQEVNVEDMLDTVQQAIQYLKTKRFLTKEEYIWAVQLQQMEKQLQLQKKQSDDGLFNEIKKHLAKMAVKRQQQEISVNW